MDLAANLTDPMPVTVPDPSLLHAPAHQTPEPQPLAWPQTQPLGAHPHGRTSLDGKAVLSHSHVDQDATSIRSERSKFTRSPSSCLLSSPMASPAKSSSEFTTTYSG